MAACSSGLLLVTHAPSSNDIASELIAREPSDFPVSKAIYGITAQLLLGRVTRRLLASARAGAGHGDIDSAHDLAVRRALGMHLGTAAHRRRTRGHRVVAHFDDALARHFDVATWQDRIDLMSGIAGTAVMLASRRDVRARELAAQALTHLETLAIESPAGVTWRTEPRFCHRHCMRDFPTGWLMSASRTECRGSSACSRSSQKRMSSASEHNGSSGGPSAGYSRRSRTSAHDSEQARPTSKEASGLAGATAIWASLRSRCSQSRALEDASLATTARTASSKSACRSPRGVPDAGFCHGAAGAAHIFNVAFQHTHDLAFREQALYWLREVVRLRSPGRGIAGYASLDISGPTPRWKDDATRLSGVVGIALVLMAALGDREPTWQRLFVM